MKGFSTTNVRGSECVKPRPHRLMKLALVLSAVTMVVGSLRAQAPGVPVVEERHGSNPALIRAATELRSQGRLLSSAEVNAQLDRDACQLTVLRAKKRKLNGRQLWERARAAQLRIGYFYKCPDCGRWHLNLADGYAISADGAVATCHHVVKPNERVKEGYLIGVTADDAVLPVLEVLAADALTDVCVVRVAPESGLEPLPLNPNVAPGDEAWCYSDPEGREGYFTHGIVSRFFRHQHGNRPAPVRMNVTTDWAPGSSGAAVLDRYGNAIGHVSEISANGGHASRVADEHADPEEKTWIVFHSAVRAADVLALVKQP